MLAAVNRPAETEGLVPGMRLADARALLPRLAVAGARPMEDRRGLERLALWCHRFAPCCAVDDSRAAEDRRTEYGLLIDSAGCAHLFGGEAAMLEEVASQLSNLGIEAYLGLADTPGAARALARFGEEGNRIAAPGATLAAIETLPVEALRIAPADAHLLRRLGLGTVGAVAALPRAPLAHRFGHQFNRGERSESVPERLDRALGRRPDPIASLPPPPACRARLVFPEPLINLAGLEAALARLAAELCAALERDGLGARELALLFCRVDGGAAERHVSTVRATRDAAHLTHLFTGKIGTVDPGFGIDVMTLHAIRAEPLAPKQLRLAASTRSGQCGNGKSGNGKFRGEELEPLIDRLQARLGKNSVFHLEPVECHLPERAERRMAPGWNSAAWPRQSNLPPRPFLLLDRPEPVETVVQVPDGPPASFTWHRLRRHIARAEGPERIEPEWWTNDPEDAPRDYYRVEDTEGRRYWLFRVGLWRNAGSGEPPRWYIHGLYG